ncbi:MAG: hypothetical protein NWS46_07410 [Cyclobacteriaceae bacterium]|jgi:hypothetical protein|nr:hypothetical protein [Cyclobacteriaceae bacterium]
MGRLHIFKFEDLEWFPSLLRNYGTDFLQFLSNKTKMYKPIIPILEKGIKRSQNNTIIDLASGGGGCLLWLNETLKKNNPELKIILTDYFPNIPAINHTKKKSANFDSIENSVDARDVPKNLKGLRTQFLSLHHFKEEDAKAILQNAVTSNNPIAIFEAQERSFSSIMAMFFSPITVLLATPFITPFKLGILLFTYLIPIVLIFIWWDRMVSCLRTCFMKKMVANLENTEEYDWDIYRIKSGPGVILYLLGTKNNNLY